MAKQGYVIQPQDKLLFEVMRNAREHCAKFEGLSTLPPNEWFRKIGSLMLSEFGVEFSYADVWSFKCEPGDIALLILKFSTKHD